MKILLDAHLSSQEETLFGHFLEGLAIYLCAQVYGGYKSERPSLDLEFSKGSEYYIVSIKSGPNWGNSDQIRQMRENFARAKAEIQSFRLAHKRVIAINGCCYGQEARPDKGDYFKYCGQDFWSLISGDSALYTTIIEPLGYRAKESNETFHEEYARMVTNFTVEFAETFCDRGKINWPRLVEFNSAHLPSTPHTTEGVAPDVP